MREALKKYKIQSALIVAGRWGCWEMGMLGGWRESEAKGETDIK